MDNLSFFVIFNIIILALVTVDFAVLSINATIKRAICLTIVWIALGILFSLYIGWMFGKERLYEYLAAYSIEKSLSIDNIFVFFLIFSRFEIQKKYQHKLLFIGIWSALIFRVLMIFIAGKLLSAFDFMIYIFGLFILYAGVESFFEHDKKTNLSAEKIVSKIKKYINIFEGDHKGRFFIKERGNWKITILVVVIFCVEVCDIVFAFDSIPALFSITNDKLIIYTSNAFAIIGLRSLYMAFAEVVNRFYYLRHGIGIILCVIGFKMILYDYIHIKSEVSLVIIIAILMCSVTASWIKIYFAKIRWD